MRHCDKTTTDTAKHPRTIPGAGSGHATNDGGDFTNPFTGNNGVVSWVEPEHPGLYNNLFFVDNLHWRLESEQPVAANPNANGGLGILGNGASLGAGHDNNGDQVFISVSELVVGEDDNNQGQNNNQGEADNSQ